MELHQGWLWPIQCFLWRCESSLTQLHWFNIMDNRLIPANLQKPQKPSSEISMTPFCFSKPHGKYCNYADWNFRTCIENSKRSYLEALLKHWSFWQYLSSEIRGLLFLNLINVILNVISQVLCLNHSLSVQFWCWMLFALGVVWSGLISQKKNYVNM